jgi:hypothetical protein
LSGGLATGFAVSDGEQHTKNDRRGDERKIDHTSFHGE